MFTYYFRYNVDVGEIFPDDFLVSKDLFKDDSQSQRPTEFEFQRNIF